MHRSYLHNVYNKGSFVFILMLLVDDDFVAGTNVVAVEPLVGIFHLFEPLQIPQVLVNIKQTHFRCRKSNDSLQP
uniref:Putative secreted protein n=1 Tax=Psorophora albipes TaxID=869069 RepID=T1DG12_9DIPT